VLRRVRTRRNLHRLGDRSPRPEVPDLAQYRWCSAQRVSTLGLCEERRYAGRVCGTAFLSQSVKYSVTNWRFADHVWVYGGRVRSLFLALSPSR